MITTHIAILCDNSSLFVVTSIHHYCFLSIHHHSVDEFMDSRAEAKRASEERMAHLRLVDEKRDRDREGIGCDDDDDDDDYDDKFTL
jgi:hypothetical protein